MKTYRIIWTISLVIMIITTAVIAVSAVSGTPIPDTGARAAGIIDLISLPVLAFTSVKLRRSSDN